MIDQQTWYQNKLAYETDAADLYADLRAGQHIVVVDGRNAQAFRQAHIPGAINLPHHTLNKATTAQLDPAALYVCYCDGIGCNGSTRTAATLLALGFRVKELIGGLAWWMQDGYETEGEAVQGEDADARAVCGCR